MVPQSLISKRLAQNAWKVSKPRFLLTATANVHMHSSLQSFQLPTTSDNKKHQSKLPQQRQVRSFQSLNKDTAFNICFVRHGQSTWNRDNRFIGWTDTPLTDDGVLEARVAGQMLQQSGIHFDEVHTSLLRRSIRTVNLVLMEMGQEYIPVNKHWRLNERSYGDLVGRNKKEAVLEHGQDQVLRWRRSYNEPPPPMSKDHPFHPAKDPRYRNVRCLLCCAVLCCAVLCCLMLW
jgi:hypothetical protein